MPPLVTQIGDGENGGVMMNEFPPMFMRVMADASGCKTPAMNATEYLEHLAAAGVSEEDFPEVRPVHQKRIWDRLEDQTGPEALALVIAQLRQEDNRFQQPTAEAGPPTSPGCAATTMCWTPWPKPRPCSPPKPRACRQTIPAIARLSFTCCSARQAASAIGDKERGPSTVGNFAGAPGRFLSRGKR